MEQEHVPLKKPGEATTFKHGLLIEMLLVFIVWIFLKVILERTLPTRGFFAYYGVVAVYCAAICFFSLRYPWKMFSVGNVGRVCKYGFGLGAIFLAILLVSYTLGTLGMPQDYNVFLTFSTFQRCFWIINIVAIAPITEELLFRGSFHRILRTRYNVLWAALFSNLFYTSVHEVGGFLCITIFIKGLLFTYAYQKTGSVWASVIVHSMNNLATVLVYCMV